MAKKDQTKEATPANVFPGADEKTPSRAQYFSWINNTNEGATEAQTLANLEFFDWLRREYGMQLDIYAFDAGAIDGPGNGYGNLSTEKFKRQFPRGLDPIYKKAKAMGTRLGVWGGPDGFGDTEADARARIDLMAGLCKDFEWALFKFDGVCGTLRKEKQDYFVKMMQECRKYSPDLILLNHRLDLGKGMPYATTSLLGGAETYIDVLMWNLFPATHHRAGALSRELPVGMSRLQEDHGVCLSSCLDFWDDDLVLQAFNRCLILAPELYGNPWFLRDDEFPRLARIYNLHRRYRDILVNAMVLKDVNKYGPLAVSRGDDATRFITMRNLEWEPETRNVTLNGEVGLAPTTAPIVVRQFHPTERVIGEFPYGTTVEVEVLAFRSCLIIAAVKDAPVNKQEVTIAGTDYTVVRDVLGKPVKVTLLGRPGTRALVSLVQGIRTFTRATIAGEAATALVHGKAIDVTFSGEPLELPWHRRLAELQPCDVPADAELLYEATCFAADNNCLEARCMARSGPTLVPEVQAARDAFFAQPIFKARAPWDKYAFDGDAASRFRTLAYDTAGLRVDLGAAIQLDTLSIKAAGGFFEKPAIAADFSTDLASWTTVTAEVHDCLEGASNSRVDPLLLATTEPADAPFNPAGDPRFAGERRVPEPVGRQRYAEILVPGKTARYVRIHDVPQVVFEIAARKDGKWIGDRSAWRMNFLFERLDRSSFDKAYHASFVLDEIPEGSYLCIPIFGEHGDEGAYAALKVDGKPVGAPDRALSYQAHPWEHLVKSATGNYTYYFPLRPEYRGKQIDAWVLGLKGNPRPMFVEAWITAYPTPSRQVELVVE
ncbi:MAG: hypothetical protein JW839_11180 [Candidatus Lokiarchaeota archaeon]|nr:hypothetical protein [Candidatus Lokiarchaeota archaeon]